MPDKLRGDPDLSVPFTTGFILRTRAESANRHDVDMRYAADRYRGMDVYEPSKQVQL